MSASASAWVRDVTEADFESQVIDVSHERPVVVDFWAPWCGPCRQFAPILEAVVNERQGQVILAKVNTDECQQLAGYFQISSIPAIKIFRNGQIVQEFEGVLPPASLRQLLDSIMPTEKEKQLALARLAETTQPSEAERIYREALEEKADLAEVRVSLARVLLAQNKLDEIAEILEPIGSEGEIGAESDSLLARLHFARLGKDFPAEQTLRKKLAEEPDSGQVRYELGCVLARQGDYPGALEMLLSAAEKDFKLAGSKVREAMVQVFYTLGSNHPLANEYRAKLSRLLY